MKMDEENEGKWREGGKIASKWMSSPSWTCPRVFFSMGN